MLPVDVRTVVRHCQLTSQGVFWVDSMLNKKNVSPHRIKLSGIGSCIDAKTENDSIACKS